jgi:hypothetical protein
MKVETPRGKGKLAVVLGLGEIGQPIFQMISDAYGDDLVYDKDIGPANWSHHNYHFKYMHVCIPQSPSFVPALTEYVKQYGPQYIIIHSTLSPGVSMYLDSLYEASVYYSPVRGNIKDGMLWSLERYTKYVAAWNYSEEVVQHMKKAFPKTVFVEDPTALEWAKILDLAWYGLNIGFYQEAERLSEEKNFDYGVVKEFIKSTPEESEGKAARTLFYGGYIGGHCVIQAIEKVLSQKDIPMLREVIFSNIQRQEELLLNRPAHHPEPRRPDE